MNDTVVLTAENFPACRTIRDFRTSYLIEFTELFTQLVRLVKWAPLR